MTASFDVHRIRQDFPVLMQTIGSKPLVYLDNAATSQKPQVVIDVIRRYYAEINANVHRGVHTLSQKATAAYEEARLKVKSFINAPSERQIIFTRGTTDGINLVVHCYGRQHIGAGDEIIISAMEHHSNIVPWQMLCEEKGATLRIIPMNERGELEIEAYKQLFSERTQFVSLVHISNSLGTVNPIETMIQIAHQHGVPVLIDGAQAVPHAPVDVQALDCDFYAFSGHKMFAATGIGVLYGKADLLERMPPYQGGGDMILSVSFDKTIYNEIPHKFEAGTPHISGVISLGAAIDYLNQIGRVAAMEYENALLDYATAQLADIPRVNLIGTAREKASIISFTIDEVHPHDIGTLLDMESIAIRAGHHCTQPVMQWFQIPATARASFAFYNTYEEVDRLVQAIHKVIEVFHHG
ncbi:MAG: cysteine desulfurase [Gemmatimonadetes bacterium]|nr:MAG: cysteine desulfurase [Gemmatimonadota bacterium]